MIVKNKNKYWLPNEKIVSKNVIISDMTFQDALNNSVTRRDRIGTMNYCFNILRNFFGNVTTVIKSINDDNAEYGPHTKVLYHF